MVMPDTNVFVRCHALINPRRRLRRTIDKTAMACQRHEPFKCSYSRARSIPVQKKEAA